MTRAVLLAHGSPDPRSGVVVRATAATLAHRLALPVSVAFLDHELPDLTSAVQAGRDCDPDDHVVILPLLLSSAFHARVDVPAAVDALPVSSSRQVSLLNPLGHPAQLLDDLLIRAAGPCVVVAAGTRVDEERDVFVAAVSASSRRTGIFALATFATGPGPRLEDVVLAGSATVIPWLLAPGRLLDAIKSAGAAHGCAHSGEGLLLEELMVAEIAARLGSAADKGLST